MSIARLSITFLYGTVALIGCTSPPKQGVEFVGIQCGMTEAEVRAVLGDDHDIDGHGAGYFQWWYGSHVIVSFNSEGRVIGVSIPRAPEFPVRS